MQYVKETAISEHDLQKKCVARLRAYNCIVSCNDVFNSLSYVKDVKAKAIIKRHLQAMGSTVGFPDITICKDGVTTYVEFKYGKGKLSPEQEIVHNQLKSQGYEVLVWRTENECYEWIVNHLKKSKEAKNESKD